MQTQDLPPDGSEGWHYEDNAQAQGPVTREALLQRYQAGLLARDALVWRQGMPGWQPLYQALPGVLPSAPPAMPPQSLPAAVPKKGMSGGMIFALIAAGLALIAIPVMGILAAIAIPAYQNYTLRAKVSEMNASLTPYKAIVAEFYQKHGRCPMNGEAGIPAQDAFTEPYMTDVYVGIDTDEDEYECIIAPTLTGFGNAALDDEELWWAYDADNGGNWLCGSTAEDRYLPSSCQG